MTDIQEVSRSLRSWFHYSFLLNPEKLCCNKVSNVDTQVPLNTRILNKYHQFVCIFSTSQSQYYGWKISYLKHLLLNPLNVPSHPIAAFAICISIVCCLSKALCRKLYNNEMWSPNADLKERRWSRTRSAWALSHQSVSKWQTPSLVLITM